MNISKAATTLTVTSVSPAKYTVTAVPTTAISATFSDSIAPSSVTDTSITVFGSLTGRHVGHAVLNATGKTLTFTPAQKFQFGENVQVTVKSVIASPGSGSLIGGYSWRFGTKTNYGSGRYGLVASPTISIGISNSIASGDFNKDGYADIAILDSANNNIDVLINNRHGGFLAPQVYAVGTNPVAIIATDVNGDGTVDLVTANWSSKNISVLINDGTGAFTAAVAYSVGTNPSGLAAADIQNDGNMDIGVTNFTDNTVTILQNDGAGIFSFRQTIHVGTGPSGIVFADFSRDGLTDAAVTNLGSNSISILRNVADSLSLDTTYVLSGGSAPTCLTTADFDTSGTADLAVGFGGTRNVAILLNAYNGLPVGRFNTSFPLIDLGTGAPSGLYCGDFNADGRMDIAASKSSPNVAVLLNSGLGAPGNTDVLAVKFSKSLVGVDFSGLGVIDLVVCGADGKMRVLRDSVTAGLSPSLSSSVSSVDFGTTKDSLSVNVVVYSSVLATRIDSVQVGSPFVLKSEVISTSLNPYDSLSISLGFKPTAGIQYASTLKIYSRTSSPASISIPVVGTGDPSLEVQRTGENNPSSFALEQNYPNPFNPSTVIQYQLPVTSAVVLEVFDITGREVAVLKQGVQSAGWYLVRWRADGIASGIYMCHITASEEDGGRMIYESTTKMVLLK